jgi:hypothetical protein
LRQLSSNDARFLTYLLSRCLDKHRPDTAPDHERLLILQENLGTTLNLVGDFWKSLNTLSSDSRVFDVSLGNVLRANLLRVSRETIAIPERMRPQDIPAPAADYYFFTGLGIEFLRACEGSEKEMTPEANSLGKRG